MSSVTITDVHAAHGDTPVLDGVDLHVAEGSTTAILGASGCGKTTLLRVVAGFMPLTGGEVRLGDRVVATPARQLPAEERGMGYVRQDGGLFPHLDVGQNIAFGWDRRRRRSRDGVSELLELVGLDPALSRRRPHELSGGQQQRVALARALALDPAVVLLDEPFAALDTALRASTRDAVAAALAERGATTILVTHDQGEALSFADQVAIMRHGVLTSVGSPVEVYESPSDVAEAAFLGDAIRLTAALETRAGAPVVRCALGQIPARDVPGGVSDGDEVEVVVRPEQVLLDDEGGRPASAGAVGEVVSSRYFGHDALVTVRLETGEDVLARVLGSSLPDVGARVHASVLGSVQVHQVG